MAARYRVTAMLKGSVKTGRSHLLKMVLRALDRMGLVEETWETYQLSPALALENTVAENPGSPRDKQLPGCLFWGFLL